ncbi:MAG: hypothetical protein Q7W45_06290 [Bacteroidota bacterium]|nr:hypothetical protein [Bacteroidota bacterium]MDP3145058.1 hypothetical protein [Bacteroidota bacterium]MDP3556090.1 hypothetical protein [Bacteroidota bacterium]
MKRFFKIVVFVCMFLYSGHSFAQGSRDKVAELRVSFISKKLEMTNSESEKFWPVYNEYNDKIKAIKRNLRQSYKKGVDNLSDGEAEELYQLDIKSKKAEAEIHEQYAEKIKAIIGAKKTVKLRVAEEEFKIEIIKNIKDKSD